MAYGFACRHCGHQEAPHLCSSILSEGEASTRILGRRLTIRECPGFEYAKKDYPWLIDEYRADPNENLTLPDEVLDRIQALEDAEGTTTYRQEVYEQQARSRAAFGWYVNHCYHERLERDIEKLDDDIAQAINPVQRKTALDAKESYLSEARNAAHLYIG